MVTFAAKFRRINSIASWQNVESENKLFQSQRKLLEIWIDPMYIPAYDSQFPSKILGKATKKNILNLIDVK